MLLPLLVACGARSDLSGELGSGASDGSDAGGVDGAVSADPHGAISVSLGYGNTCVALRSGEVECLGLNDCGQLGNGTRGGSMDFAAEAAPVLGLNQPAVQVSVGQAHACALLVDGSVQCWGGCGVLGGGWSPLGNGTDGGSTTPVKVVGLAEPVRQIDAGLDSNCALLASGRISCWGRFVGLKANSLPAAALAATQITVGDSAVVLYAMSADGALSVLESPTRWRPILEPSPAAQIVMTRSASGTGDVLLQVPIAGGLRWSIFRDTKFVDLAPPTVHLRSVAGGTSFVCGVIDSGDVRCITRDGSYAGHGELGAGPAAGTGDCRSTWSCAPNVVGLGGRATQIAAMAGNVCAILESGAVRCWGAGAGAYGVVGFAQDQFTATTVPGFP